MDGGPVLESQTPTEVHLDSLDWDMMAHLRENGRLSVAELAARLGVSEPTARKRLRNLLDSEYIRIVALPSQGRIGFGIDLLVNVQVEMGKVREVAEELAVMEEITYVGVMLGAYDLVLAASFASREEVYEFLFHKIPQIPGVIRTESFYILQVVKRTFGRLPAPAPARRSRRAISQEAP